MDTRSNRDGKRVKKEEVKMTPEDRVELEKVMMEGLEGDEPEGAADGAGLQSPADPDYEPPMVNQGDVHMGSLQPGQGLLATAKLLSATLLGGGRYRIAMKVGLWKQPDMIVTFLLDAEKATYQAEGSFAAPFEFYANHSDPLDLSPSARQLWFGCHAVDSWLARQLESKGMGMTLVWGE